MLLNAGSKEQIVLSGYSTDKKVGASVTLSVNWKKGSTSVLSKEYSMSVLKDDGEWVWIGDDSGKGVIIE